MGLSSDGISCGSEGGGARFRNVDEVEDWLSVSVSEEPAGEVRCGSVKGAFVGGHEEDTDAGRIEACSGLLACCP